VWIFIYPYNLVIDLDERRLNRMKMWIALIIALASRTHAANLASSTLETRGQSRGITTALPFVRDAREFAIEGGKGALYGYGGVAALLTMLDGLATLASRDSSTGTTVSGRWVLDAVRSDSLEPFLVSVGAPKLVARMVGKRGKPVDITVHEGEVHVRVEGKDVESFTVGSTSLVRTPRGTSRATLVNEAGWRSFQVTKSGPTAGESTVETRELMDDGNVLRCTFVHDNPTTGIATTVVRYYTRRVGEERQNI
jgi:hypothetical protein